jgi:predicted HicB family RNase H-like nuclease
MAASTLNSRFHVLFGRNQQMEMAVATPVAHEERKQTAQRIAAEMFSHQPDWVTFFREVLGVDGLVRRLFSKPEDLVAFEKTDEYAEIQQMLAKLREVTGSQADGKEPTRVITVRLPKSLHESLRAEAHDRKTSMNQLCISKLLQVIDAELLPAE